MLLNKGALAQTLEGSTSQSTISLLSYRDMKEILDAIGAFLLLVATSPLMIVCALLVKLSSRGPVIFRQTRLTKGGAEFSILKFRTMVQDAEATTGAVWAKANDPRVTTVGRFLRQTRLDELPQLFNVLKGDMSLIGPRPERPELVYELTEHYPHFRRRLNVKAGITGLAQVDCGYCAGIRSYAKKIERDLAYVENMSFALDVKIALRTVITILTMSGAR